MDSISQQLLGLPDTSEAVVVAIRLMTAALLGGVIGAERSAAGKAAGVRTHMLVALGSALFIVAPDHANIASGDLGRIIQGVAAGIGFIGAGTILKLTDREAIRGLTTASSVWLTAAIGVASAIGRLWVPIGCTVLAWVILYFAGRAERRLAPR